MTSKITFALLLAAVLVPGIANAQPVATYDFATGEIIFDQFDGVTAVRLFSDAGNLIPNVGEGLGYPLTERTETLYSWLDFGAGVTGDGLSAGNIVAPGTPGSDLSFDYKLGLIAPITVGEIITINDVPEPATLAIAGVGILGMFVSRRRRS